MKFTESITQNWLFRQMYRRSESVVCRNIVVYLKKNKCGINRLGLTAAKSVGKAVERNRARRLMREAYRLNEDKLKCGFDCIIVARTRAKDAKLSYIEKDFLYAAEKLMFFRGGD